MGKWSSNEHLSPDRENGDSLPEPFRGEPSPHSLAYWATLLALILLALVFLAASVWDFGRGELCPELESEGVVIQGCSCGSSMG
jgi:hypothetical protein